MKTIWSPLKVYQYLQKNDHPVNSDALCTKNFAWSELLVKQAESPSLLVLKNLLKTAQTLQKYRDSVFENSSIVITSGWRSSAYNKKIGGAFKSYHIYGLALDFIVTGFSPHQVQSLLDPIHYGGLEFAPSWTHMDMRNEVVRFDNQGKVIRK
ncbi:MAG: hypothetical protein A2287_07130 [Candidatus Melainabacteria bacterium RIFOXYA12_FULL_32_12]|nr:MAG: hypothetical protein A2287_07130 [Candidatus Melainabacteria bacterium RIFOXYA12_FULL_32_12]